ncbi:MAG TPA: hypothetical protein VHX37_13400 [Acidobacteriaceae bacterium]|nr:hypothetical protein [Acidobacteriaceae bacterium]
MSTGELNESRRNHESLIWIEVSAVDQEMRIEFLRVDKYPNSGGERARFTHDDLLTVSVD